MFVEQTDTDNEIPSFEASEVADENDGSPGILLKILEGEYQGVQFFISEEDDSHMKYSLVKNPKDIDIPQPFADSLCQMLIFKITEGFPEHPH